MKSRKLTIFLIGVFSIVAFFLLPANRRWLADRVLCEECDVYKQADHLGTEERMSERFGGFYDVMTGIQNMVRSANISNPIVLLPTNNYTHAMKLEQPFDMPDPSVFYYFTGIKSVCASSPGTDGANWVLLVKDGQLWVKAIRNKQERDSLITIFKNYIR